MICRRLEIVSRSNVSGAVMAFWLPADSMRHRLKAILHICADFSDPVFLEGMAVLFAKLDLKQLFSVDCQLPVEHNNILFLLVRNATTSCEYGTHGIPLGDIQP